MEETITESCKLKTWYDFDEDIFEAVHDFIDKYGCAPDIIAFNQHTYNQICYILSVSPKRQLYFGKEGKNEILFNYLEVDFKPFYHAFRNNRHNGLPPEEEEHENGMISIYNPFGPDYVKFFWEGCAYITYRENDDLKNKEFRLIYVDEDEDDDSDDDNFDETPVLPIESNDVENKLILNK